MYLDSTIPPHSGCLLISEPFLQDENFVRSVVLLCENNDKGSFGLVLNKLSLFKLGDLLDGLLNFDSDVYVGGPVEQNTLHFIYFGEKKLQDSISLQGDLWWGGDFNELIQKCNSGSLDLETFRFFIGYSGWTGGQLDEELEEKTWIVCKNDFTDHIFFSDPDELWRVILKNMGGDYQVLANYPIDPRLN
ncbi:MAG: YqgE/AlgH family protein [Lunatimonas sp.]|uniref:YqgE/AlgH family protein n=1 Tax=Lunatimonas sp. TaxID=2060141 RepID=UPI00263AC1C3|nr:YqgE/AlgH family protein [Lunatimonas sp.]MCC5937226.1 YqgE/AlgH family protein [Lunatimonas sp.]